MTDQKNKLNLAKFVLHDINQERKSKSCLGQTCFRYLIVFCPNFLAFCWLRLVAFGEFIFHKFVTNQLFGWEFWVMRQDYEQVNFYNQSCFYIVGRSISLGRVTTYLQLAQNWKLSIKFWQNLLFNKQSQQRYDVMQKEIDNLEFFNM